MSRNRESHICNVGVTTFDKAIKERNLSLGGQWSVRAIAIIRNEILNNEDLLDDFNVALRDSYEDNADRPDIFKATLPEFKKELEKKEEAISNKLRHKEELTKEENTFFINYVSSMNKVLKEAERADLIAEKLLKAGVSSSEIPELYDAYKKAIPVARYRQEITYQILSIMFGYLDYCSQHPKHLEWHDLTTEELITAVGPNNIFTVVRNRLASQSTRDKLENKINALLDKQKQDGALSDADKIVLSRAEAGLNFLNALANDKSGKIWSACLFMAKDTFAKATKIRIVNDYTNNGKQIAERIEDGEDEIETEDLEYDAESESPEHWMLKTDTISTLNSMSAEIKSLFYKLTTNDLGILGFKHIGSIVSTYRKLISLRYKTCSQNSDEFIAALRAAKVKDYPFVTVLLEELQKDTTGSLKTKLFNTLKKNDLHYIVYDEKFEMKDGVRHKVFYERKEGPSENLVFGNYASNVLNIEEDNDKCIFKVNGIIDNAKKASFITEFRDGNAALLDVKTLEGRRNAILLANNCLNMHMTEADINDLVNNSIAYKDFINYIKDVADTLKTDTGITTFAIAAADSTISRALRKATKIARHYFLTTEEITESVFRYNKSTYQTVTIPNYIGDVFERLLKAFKKGNMRAFLEERYLKNPIFCRKNDKNEFVRDKNGNILNITNPLLEMLYNGENAEDFLTSLTRGLGTKNKVFENFSEADNIAFTLVEYLTKYSESDKKLGRMPLFITGDSNSSRYMTCPVFSTEEAKDRLVDIAMSELEKQKVLNSLSEICKGNKSIEENKDKFTIFPSLNAQKENIDKLATYEEKRDFIKGIIEVELKHLFEEDFLKTLKKENLITGYNTIRLNYEKISSPAILALDKTVDGELLYNMYLNLKLGIISQQQLLTIDTGFYVDVIDLQKRFKEMIASGETLDLAAIWKNKDGSYEYVAERESKNPKNPDNSKGIWRKGKDNQQTCIYIKDIKRSSSDVNADFIACLKSNGMPADSIAKYSSNNLTDGQGYRSFPSYRRIMIMRGLWTPNMQQVYEIIETAHNEGRDLTIDEFKKIESLNVVFQPIKPFYYGFEYMDNDTAIPVQHKYAEIPLIPELLPKNGNNMLRNLGNYIWDTNVDLACFDSCVKVGGYGSVDISNASDYDTMRSALDNASTHYLHLEGYRQQTNVPEHNDNTRSVGSQFLRHMFGCIDLAHTLPKHYKFLDKFKDKKIYITKNEKGHINIKEGLSALGMIKYYGALGCIGYMKSAIKLINSLKSVKDISRTLTELHGNDSRSAKDTFSAFEVYGDNKLRMSLAEGVNASDNIAALFSMFKKQVVKQGMKGGSAVQVSAFGYDDTLKIHFERDANGNPTNITYADCTMPFDLSVNDAEGNQIKLDYFEFVDPHTGNLLKEDGTAFTDEEIDELEKKGVDWRKLSKLEKKYSGILDLLAYRIPTERAYSILNLKIRKFTPRTMGGIIMVPLEYTTIAGFDFRQYWSH